MMMMMMMMKMKTTVRSAPDGSDNKPDRISILCIFVQITHTEEMPESMMMKNAVISVFFLRFLQHGKYFKRHVPEKKKVCFGVNL